MAQTKDTAGVIAPPPLIFGGSFLIGWAVNWFFALPSSNLGLLRILGVVLIAFAFAIILIAFLQMRKKKTAIEPWHPTTAIVSNGVYGFSRNPIYVAMTIGFIGAAVTINEPLIVPFLAIALPIMQIGVIKREERYLERLFGEEYLQYKQRVRRWI